MGPPNRFPHSVDPTELLRVQMQQITWLGPLVAHDRWARLQAPRRCRPSRRGPRVDSGAGDLELPPDPVRPEPFAPTQSLDPTHRPGRDPPGDPVRTRGAVTQALLALPEEPAHPLRGGLQADPSCPGGGTRRPSLVDHSRADQQPRVNRQTCAAMLLHGPSLRSWLRHLEPKGRALYLSMMCVGGRASYRWTGRRRTSPTGGAARVRSRRWS